MARLITGQCRNCGDAAHPKGNVFHVADALYFQIDYPHQWAGDITTHCVKVCNNCNTPHPFHTRKSAKRKQTEALFDALFAQEAE